MKKVLAKILLIVMIINTIFSTGLTNVFANLKSTKEVKAKGSLELNWNETLILTDLLEPIKRPENSDKAFLSWGFDTQNGAPVGTGTFELKYFIGDGREAKLKVKKNAGNAIVEYFINNDNTVNAKEKMLEVYKPDDKTYKEATRANFPENDPNFKINFPSGNQQRAQNVSFTIKKGTGFNFNYLGNTIKFKWDNSGYFFFETDGISQGNIYDFNLSFVKDGSSAQIIDKIKIFTGINEATFKSRPIANDGKGESMQDPVDQTTRPIIEYPGQNPKLEISFELPKEYDNIINKYDYVKDTTNNKKATKAVLDLISTSGKTIQVVIDNVYDPNKFTVSPNDKVKVKVTSEDNRITILLENKEGVAENEKILIPGIIYSSTKISLIRNETVENVVNDECFKSIPAELPIGAVYTYIEYSIISLGAKEFYINITPFEGYNGYYIVKQGSAILEEFARYEEKNKGQSNILIPVPIEIAGESSPEKYFQVDFEFAPSGDNPSETIRLSSQILKYKGYFEDIELGVPQNLKVTESDIIRQTSSDGTIRDELFVTFEWKVGYESVLKRLFERNQNKPFDIIYTFYEDETPTGDGEKLVSVKLTVNGDGIIEYSATDEYKDNFISGETELIEESLGGSISKIAKAKVKFKIPVSEKNSGVARSQLEYPGIYFITTEGVYTINDKLHNTGKSLSTTLTLNGVLQINVPEPQNIKIIDNSVTDKSFKVGFDTLKYEKEENVLYKYLKQILERHKLTLNDNSVKYNFYITQDRSIFDEMIKVDTTGKDKYDKIPEDIKSKIKTYDYENKVINEQDILNVKEMKLSDGTSIIDNLRNDNVVKITNMTQNFEASVPNQIVSLDGLDENQIYYVIAETVIEPVFAEEPNQGQVDKSKIDISKYSKIITVTTLKDDEGPGENEKVPSAPTNFRYENVTLNSANLLWDKINEDKDENSKSTLEYQFIKVRGQKLDDNFLNSKENYNKTWELLSNIKNKAGFKTSKDKVLEYKDSTFEEASQDRYVYQDFTSATGNILDKTLSPNQVYFYYIRTVRVDENGKDVAYSVWVPLSLTTKNVEGPTNLKVERDAEYDKKSEVVISFDIPKISTDLIGTEYELQYSLKKDVGPWGKDITMPKKDLTITENKDGKTLKVVYKIKGLKSGTTYTIRVRMYNKPIESASLYSNEVDHRTDIDEGDKEDEDKIDEWENHFKDLVNQLKKEPYWYIEDSIGNTAVFYRPDHFDVILNSTQTGVIDLAQGIGGSKKEYFIPSKAVIKAFEQNKGFKVTYNGMDVIFSSKSINPTQNEAIKMLESKRASDKLADYFVKLTIDFKQAPYIIEGNNSISPVADVYFEVVGTKRILSEWDADVVLYIDKLLKKDKYSKDLRADIKQWIKDKKDSLFISQQINKYFEEFKKDFGSYVGKQLKATSKRTFTTTKLNGNIIITYPFEKTLVAKGYKLILGSWVNVSIIDYAGKKAISTNELGAYIFTASKLIINGVGNLPNGTVIMDIIIKYGLDDYLGKGNINLKGNLTRYMAIGSLARIAGNSRTKDPIEFFKTKGVIVNSRNETLPISNQEAIYLIMEVYEIRTNKKIETIKVRNYNKTANIKGINDKYKKAIQVAFELGIYNDENMNPNGNMSIEQFLNTLANLSSKIGI